MLSIEYFVGPAVVLAAVLLGLAGLITWGERRHNDRRPRK